MNLSIHTAPDVQPVKCINGFASATKLLPLPVGSELRQNNATPSVQPHYSAFIPNTGCSAPVFRIGTPRKGTFTQELDPSHLGDPGVVGEFIGVAD